MLKYRGANLALHRKQIMKLVRVLKNTSKFLAGAGKQPSTQSSRNASDAYAHFFAVNAATSIWEIV
jgi:hypothetical protein